MVYEAFLLNIPVVLVSLVHHKCMRQHALGILLTLGKDPRFGSAINWHQRLTAGDPESPQHMG